MSDLEIYALDVDWDLINHIVIRESFERIRAEGLTEELIEDDYVKEVFRFQSNHLREHGVIATPSVIEDEFDDVGIGEPLTVIDDLIERLRDRYIANNGKQVLRDLMDSYMAEPRSLPESMIRTGRELGSLIVKKGEVYGTGDYDRTMLEYDKNVTRGRGPSFGYRDIDDYFYGQRGLCFVIAPPKTMKSWLTVNALIENVTNGVSCVLYSLELPAVETDMRVRFMAADIPWWKYIKGSLTMLERERLKEVSEMLDSCGLYRVVKPERGERSADYLIERARDAGGEAIFIDQLQYMENDRNQSLGEKNDTGEYFGQINKLKDHSDDGPIWVVHQFNRSTMGAEKMPEIQQAKGSAAIEEACTLALGLFASKDMKSSNVVEFGTLISRNFFPVSWELEVNLNRGCGLNMIGRREVDE
jgi:hypothetical protein